MDKRSFYQCLNAKVDKDKIYCAAGHILSVRKDGRLDLRRVRRGEPLELAICQRCSDYDEMGPPVARQDRGRW